MYKSQNLRKLIKKCAPFPDTFSQLNPIYKNDCFIIPFYGEGKTLKEIAEALIPKVKADVYNYGLLDIGSKICHYKYIKCEKCPVNNYCLFSIKKME